MDTSRRDLFRIVGTSMALSPALSPAMAQQASPAYKPKCFTAHQFQTLHKLADLIIPGASEAGASEYIDLLSSHNEELATIFTGGMGWLDDYMTKTYGADFLTAKPDQQTAVLDTLAWREKYKPETAGGRRFWTWTRNMVVDAYYTSAAGVADIGYKGNGAMSHFSVPKEAVDYAMKRSPFANEG